LPAVPFSKRRVRLVRVEGLAIRPAQPNEGEALRAIASAAKSHWGYDEDRVRRWAAGCDFSPEALAARAVLVADLGGHPIGFAALTPQGELCVLDDLWIDPPWIGRGIGTRLFQAAAERARDLGGERLEWEAEPNAVGFYERMGGRYLRESEPTEFGRRIPVMGLDLTAATLAGPGD
jgi:GNAT superfamily N-acetyltransferase